MILSNLHGAMLMARHSIEKSEALIRRGVIGERDNNASIKTIELEYAFSRAILRGTQTHYDKIEFLHECLHNLFVAGNLAAVALLCDAGQTRDAWHYLTNDIDALEELEKAALLLTETRSVMQALQIESNANSGFTRDILIEMKDKIDATILAVQQTKAAIGVQLP